MQPVLIIGGHDYSTYISELTPTKNDLDADGSGRDVQTGTMFRTRIATKLQYEVRLPRLSETLIRQLYNDISDVYYQATILDPRTNTRATKTFYTSSMPFGAQRYDKHSGTTYYYGTTFTMTER